ncbi:MAG: YeaC family protein [Colwellia sp.]
MNLQETITNMPESMYQRLKCAAETGKWPEGTPVDKAQRATALQLTMAYQAKMQHNDEMLTIGPNGEIVTKTKREIKAYMSGSDTDEPMEKCDKPSNPVSDIAHFKDI